MEVLTEVGEKKAQDYCSGSDTNNGPSQQANIIELQMRSFRDMVKEEGPMEDIANANLS